MQHILFVELLGGIGDVVIALPAIHALARSHPAAKITVLTFAPGGTLLEGDPLIDQVIYANRECPRQSVETILTEKLFDLIVSDTNYDGIADGIAHSSVPWTITNLWRSPPPDEKVSDRFIKILYQEGLISSTEINTSIGFIYLTQDERNRAKQLLGAAARPLIALIPDAGMTIKKWSAESYIELANTLISDYNVTLLVPQGFDQALTSTLLNGIQKNTYLVPKQDLRNLAAILAEADLAIAADTGLARITAALQVPTITLFGPSWHGRYGQPSPHINLQGYPDCPERRIDNFTEQSCWYSGQCPYEWRSCLDAISPAQVMDAAQQILQTEDKKQNEKKSIENHHQTQIDSLEINEKPQLSPAWRSIQKLLVMRLDNIGDVIMTSPALRSLKQNLPNATLTLMASPAGALTAPLLVGVDDVLPWRVVWQDLGRLELNPDREWQLIETLRSRQFDAAIILTSFAQSPHPAAFVCAMAGIPLRLGESKEQDFCLTHAIPPAPDELHQVERNLRLIEWVGFQVDDRRLSLTIPSNPLITQPYLLLNPWTSCPARNYDPERFAIAARQLSEITGWRVGVTGVAKDRDRAQLVLSVLAERAIDLIGQTTLPELVSLVAHAQLLLTNNTSTMHIADATGTPTIVLFAGTEKDCQWRPRYTPHRLLHRPTVCSPCYAFTCPYELQCLDIPAETVVNTALDLLKTQPNLSKILQKI